MIFKRWACLQDKIHIHDWFYFGNTRWRGWGWILNKFSYLMNGVVKYLLFLCVPLLYLHTISEFRSCDFRVLSPSAFPSGHPALVHRLGSVACSVCTLYSALSVLCRVRRCGMFSVHYTQCSQSSPGCAAVACSVTLHSVLFVLCKVRLSILIVIYWIVCCTSSMSKYLLYNASVFCLH